MRAISFERSSFAQTVIVSLVTFASLTLLCLVLAYWTWVWFAPRSEPRAQQALQTTTRMEAAHGLFGRAPTATSLTGSVLAQSAPTGIAIRLLGIVAATTGRSGYAVVQLEAKGILALREGEDLAPGIRLAAVSADHLILERGGIRETLAWPDKKVGDKNRADQNNVDKSNVDKNDVDKNDAWKNATTEFSAR